jgi:DNA polymerase/3'-5' exonuclease PolX
LVRFEARYITASEEVLVVPVQNAEVAAMFDQAAELLEIEGENQFRVRAYRRAARTVEGLPQSIKSLLAAGRDLSELPGIGKDLAGKIAEIVETGHFPLLDTLKKKLPGELGEMAALPGLGPKRLKLLHDRLKVNTFDDLRRIIKTGRLHRIKGFGPTIEQKLSAALEKPVTEKRFRISVAEAEAEALVSFLRGSGRVVVAGSYRRRRDTVGDVDLVVTAAHAAAVGDQLVNYENVAEVLAHGGTRTTVVLRSAGGSSLDADQRPQPRYASGEARLLGRGHDRTHVLVGAGRLLGDAAHRWAFDDDATLGKLIHDLAAAPLLERGVPRQRPSGAVARRGERLAFSRRLGDQNIRTGAHAAADEHRLTHRAQCVGQAWVPGTECPGRALAVNE